MSRSGIELSTLVFKPGALDQFATETIVLFCTKLLQRNQHAAIQCIKLIKVRCVFEQTIRQNLHFFSICSCYLILFTERCMNTPKMLNLWSINNPEFENYKMYLGQMYPVELEIKDTTESNTSSSYLDLLLSIGKDGQLPTSIYDKRDDLNFHIINFPFLSSNFQTSPAYGIFISQLIRYARACSYECFILKATRLK